LTIGANIFPGNDIARYSVLTKKTISFQILEYTF
jgi:hypothetical protein